jgi:DNA-binding PadR family transcriptional regulator
MHHDQTLSTLSLAILGIISLEPVSGYDIRKVFRTTPMGHFSASPGAIYPALKRLEESGFIKGYIEKKNTLRPKRTYTLTDNGLEIMKQILAQPVIRQDIVWRLEEMMLRFVFIGNVLGREQSLRFLKELAFQIDEYIPVLRKNLDIQRKLKHINGGYALEQGIAKYKATARWARRVIKDFELEASCEKEA